MKTLRLHLVACLALASTCLTALPSCSTGGKIDADQVGQITDLALTYATATGKITPADAALVRQAKEIILPSTPVPVSAPAIVPSGKATSNVLADTNALDRPYQRARATRSKGVRSTQSPPAYARFVNDDDGDDDGELARKHPLLVTLAKPVSAR